MVVLESWTFDTYLSLCISSRCLVPTEKALLSSDLGKKDSYFINLIQMDNLRPYGKDIGRFLLKK